jgi:hypothetical protein
MKVFIRLKKIKNGDIGFIRLKKIKNGDIGDYLNDVTSTLQGLERNSAYLIEIIKL